MSPSNEAKPFATILRLVDEFRKLDPEMQAQQMAILVHVMLEPGITMKRLSSLLGLSQSSTSRNIAALSETHRHGVLGHDLVRATEDPMERRRKVVNLTPKGQRIANSLVEIIK